MAGLTEAGRKTAKTHWREVECASQKFNQQITQTKRSLFKRVLAGGTRLAKNRSMVS